MADATRSSPLRVRGSRNGCPSTGVSAAAVATSVISPGPNTSSEVKTMGTEIGSVVRFCEMVGCDSNAAARIAADITPARATARCGSDHMPSPTSRPDALAIPAKRMTSKRSGLCAFQMRSAPRHHDPLNASKRNIRTSARESDAMYDQRIT